MTRLVVACALGGWLLSGCGAGAARPSDGDTEPSSTSVRLERQVDGSWTRSEEARAREAAASAEDASGEVDAVEAAPEPLEGEARLAAMVGDEVGGSGAAELFVEGIKLVEDQGQTGVFLKLSREADRVRHFMLGDPPRLVVDFFGPVARGAVPVDRRSQRSPLVDRVRFGRHSDRLRVVFDLEHDVSEYSLDTLNRMTVAFLGERTDRASGPPEEEVLFAMEQREAPPLQHRRAAASPVETAEAPARATAASERPPPALSGDPVYTGERISLDFKDADVLNVLRILAEVSDLNIVATDDVRGRITLKLTDVPWDQALDIVLRANRLDMVREGNVIRVSTVTRLKEERESQLAAQEAAKELEPLRTEYARVNYMKLEEDDRALTAKLEDVMSNRGRVRIDARTNTVILRDIQAGIADAKELLEELDKRTPQVLIESHVVEANDTFRRDLGIQWGYQLGVGPQFGSATGREFPATMLFGGSGLGTGGAPGAGPATEGGGAPVNPLPFIADFPVQSAQFGPGGVGGSAFDIALGSIDGSKALNARLTALENDGKVKIISRPKVVTINNQLATIESLRIFRVRLPSTGTVISTGAGGVAGTAASATEKIETGIRLEVTPQVSADGFVLMRMHVKSSTADFTQAVDGIPAEDSREATTNVLIKDGETVVLGGVYRNETARGQAGIPFLRSIPVIGWLFKNYFRDQNRQELMVFITPRLVGGGAQIATDLPPAEELWRSRPR